MGKIKGWPPAILTPVPAADIRRGSGKDIVEFIEQFCPQVKDSIGGKAFEPLLLRPWQKKLLVVVYARRPDGRLRHRTFVVMLPRRSGKSALGSVMARYSWSLGSGCGEG